MLSIEANQIDLTNFHPVLAEYGPKGIFAPAALVTDENIGQIALELEEDVQYFDRSANGTPYIRILATRHSDDPIELTITPGYWIVLVWNEIHLFKDELFQNTFEVAISSDPEPPLERPEPKHIGDPVIPRVGRNYHAGSLYKSEGQDPSIYEKDTVETVEKKEYIDRLLDRQAEKADVNEQTQFIPHVSTPMGPRSEMIHTGTADNVEGGEPKTNAEKVQKARQAWEPDTNQQD